MQIEWLQGKLPISENAGLDSTDPRLDEITTLSQAGNHAEAAKLSAAILDDGIMDIRLIGFVLYGHWLEQGLASLLALSLCVNNVILDNWLALGSSKNLNRNVEKSLDWLYRQVLKKLQYEESKNSPLWQGWQADANTVNVAAILEAGERLRFGLNQRLEDKARPLIDQWSKIEQWLSNFQRLSYRPPEIAANIVETEVEEVVAEKAPTPTPNIAATGLQTEMSYHMALLLKKLAAFERVVQDNRFVEAALLAGDINESINNFDPKLYFPKLFESFVRLQALNFEALSTTAQQSEEQQWQAMQEWLKVDIDSFINKS